MIDRKRKPRSNELTTRQLRFEPLESRVQFAVDYLSYASDSWQYEAPMAFEASDFVGDWSSQRGSALDSEWDPAYDLGWPSVAAYRATDSVDSGFWNLSPASAIAVGDSGIYSDSPLDAGIFGTTDGDYYKDGDYYTEAFRNTEPLEIFGISMAPTSSISLDMASSGSSPLISQGPFASVEPTFSNTDQLGGESIEFELLVDSSDDTAYVIVGQVPFDASISPETFLRYGPSIEVYAGAQDSLDDSIFFVGLSSGTALSSPATHTAAISQTQISSALTDAAMSPLLVYSLAAIDVLSNAGRNLAGMELPVVSKASAQFDTSSQLAEESHGTSIRLLSPTQYVPLSAIAQQLPIDVDLGTQLPVDMTTPQDRGVTARVKLQSSAIGIEAAYELNRVVNVSSAKNLLPAGMLAIGNEPGSLAARVSRSQQANEHFVVQSLLICENLQRVEIPDEHFSGGTAEEPSEPLESNLPAPSLSVIVVGCLLAMTQTAIKPKKSRNVDSAFLS